MKNSSPGILEVKGDMTVAGVIVVAAYIAAQMLSDILSLKIALVAGFSIDVGTFTYPFTFTLRDLVHKRLGRTAARTVIVAAGVINLLMAALFAFAAWLPPDPTWPLQQEFAVVLTPVWHIVIASIIAEIVSEFTDTEVYHLWVTRITRRYQWARVLVSNAVSIPVDSLIFCCFIAGFAKNNDSSRTATRSTFLKSGLIGWAKDSRFDRTTSIE